MSKLRVTHTGGGVLDFELHPAQGLVACPTRVTLRRRARNGAGGLAAGVERIPFSDVGSAVAALNLVEDVAIEIHDFVTYDHRSGTLNGKYSRRVSLAGVAGLSVVA